ncbi:polyphenol oxidase family protein [Clostridium chauvoei]|uniref:Polyphenol oxidase family protein n=2 Tax=Clostridium chauvoei TaxID=46867 RepID=A0ABD4RGZ5_9CLOT|nr:polyphenol oxidase family protein [Clostridium chauvoei]ATD54895.1 laccase [Clostridium chauvoei]ATD57426.1 laccase [Clostridium chauvoei]MBX7280491.1 polyphenol oxidase family protein [Clostridium chauvoei]MBX7282976.1 polyphenol oxidase family protein [Clostridium chauvoei]MBX7285493.1 polyphenol oxidase family protein [Clostridium chauvoei]
MKKLTIDDFKRYKDFLKLDLNNISIVFSTAENNRSFNKHTQDGVDNLNSIKADFNLDNIEYLNQIHSDKSYIYNKYNSIKDKEGDAVITHEEKTAIGVFTADCTPIILINEEKKVIAAIHSGWKGTFNSIVLKTLDKMIKEYDIDLKTTKAFIGPHIRKCCYEISEELKEDFIKHTGIEEKLLFDGRNLSMETVIIKDLINAGILDENVYSLDICTHCCKDLKMHSYRASVGTYGRLFSFAYIK